VCLGLAAEDPGNDDPGGCRHRRVRCYPGHDRHAPASLAEVGKGVGVLQMPSPRGRASYKLCRGLPCSCGRRDRIAASPEGGEPTNPDDAVPPKPVYFPALTHLPITSAMELVRGLHNLRPHHRGCVATIGNFDGVHAGHRTILKRLSRHAERLGLPGCVVIFEPQPREYFAPQSAPPRLTRLRDKLALLEEQGVDRVLCLAFNRRLREL